MSSFSISSFGRPFLPFDILTTIAQTSIEIYHALLALPRFGRRSLQLKHQILHQSHFTTHIIKHYAGGFIAHVWHLDHRSYNIQLDTGDDLYYRHRLDAPADIHYDPDGHVIYEAWYEYDEIHRSVNLGPAIIYYHPNGQKASESWYERGQCHRLDAPASIHYHPNDQKAIEYWYNHNQYHRLDGPAAVGYNLSGIIINVQYYLYDVEYSRKDYEAKLLELTRQQQ
jgi:hypothetical protein